MIRHFATVLCLLAIAPAQETPNARRPFIRCVERDDGGPARTC
jgi:hypothetical protein